MRFAYLAKHDSGGNDDEGAITHALRELGHEVNPLRESRGHVAHKLEGDVLLFHKWDDHEKLASLKDKFFRVFWYFDLVDWPSDPTLAERCRLRKEWMAKTLPHVELGFCTDGDWVERHNSAAAALHPDPQLQHLVNLPQGFDDRLSFVNEHKDIDILFVGNERGGVAREDFARNLRQTYGSRFTQVRSGCHGEDLATLIARAKLVVAPISPVTDRYWSNRLYLMCGLGACLLHPYSKGVEKQYEEFKEVLLYKNWNHLTSLIDGYLNNENLCRRIEKRALERTRKEHLYRHRCEALVNTIKERLSCRVQSST